MPWLPQWALRAGPRRFLTPSAQAIPTYTAADASPAAARSPQFARLAGPRSHSPAEVMAAAARAAGT